MTDERSIAGGNFVFFGGTSGIGKATATALATRGANILLVARDKQAGADAVAGMLRAGAASAAFLPADLTTIGGMQKAAWEVQAWRPALHGAMHSAMSGFNSYETTGDGLEFSFALQYFARAVVNRLLADALAASGDGRIVHVAGSVPQWTLPPLDDLQFERRKWGFFKAVLGTHALGFLHIQEATRLWRDRPVTLAACAVGPTKTKVMQDKRMPLIMRLQGKIGTTPEKAARNFVTYLTAASVTDASGAVLRSPKKWNPEKLDWDQGKAAELWAITTHLAAQHGVALPS